ncbi:hypothetical protein VitviT2T_017976 [Vitis vinifera]|uniref:Inhibitor I9 domain-containing protein n=1 Tax=Vitis vinifera TaxID=29760 RepID=A0ABY9CWM9_VITVI|nr:hypothetical protein VitviT2T_017976 [Vitis vinifera]
MQPLFNFNSSNELLPKSKACQGHIIYSVNSSNHYIVYMGDHSYQDLEFVVTTNHEMLASVTGSVDRAQAVALHHYNKSFRGFSVMLTPEQA